MEAYLVKEALIRLAKNWELKAPHFCDRKKEKPHKPVGSFGFKVPEDPTKKQKYDYYYYGDPAAMPKEYKYKKVTTGIRKSIPGIEVIPSPVATNSVPSKVKFPTKSQKSVQRVN